MKILDCPKKEVFIIKSQGYVNSNGANLPKINELLSSMVVNEPDEAVLSEDSVFNNHIHSLKKQNNIMKLSIGKDDSKLTVFIRGVFPEKPRKEKIEKKQFLPWHILKSHLFPFFTAVELFKYRIVCPLWKVMITGMWHSIFKREMYTQFLVTNFTREIEKGFKLLAVRQPIAQKFYLYASTICEMIDWNEMMNLTEVESRFQKKAKLLIVTLVKLMNYNALPIARLSQYDEVTWAQTRALLPDNIKSSVLNFAMNGSPFPHIRDLEK